MNRSSHARSFHRVLSIARRMNAAEDGRPEPLPEPVAGWSRRHFLRMLAGAGSAAAVSAVCPPARAAGAGSSRIVVLGAGLAGLNAAYQLKKRGIASTVYEARGRVGGRVRTVRGAFGPGSITDVGGELVNANHADMIRLAADFGIGLFDRLADAAGAGIATTSYLIHGEVVPEETVAENFRALARRIGRDAAKIDADPDKWFPIFDRLSAKDYLDRHADSIPRRWVRDLIEQSVRSEYGVEPGRASSLVFLYNLPVVNGTEFEMLGGSDERFLVDGGAAAIPEAIAADLGGAVRLNHTCRSIVRTAGGSYRIAFEGGLEVSADILICALPLTVLRRLELDMQLPEKFMRFIREVDLGTNEKVIAGFESRFWRTGHLFANEFWSTGKFTSAWDAGQRQPGRAGGVLTFFTGGEAAREALESTARRKAERFVKALGTCYPQAPGAFTSRAFRSRWKLDARCHGAYTNFAPGQATRFAAFSWFEDLEDAAANQEIRFKDAYFIGEHASSEFYGFMNGAAETGRLAAGSVLRRMGISA